MADTTSKEHVVGRRFVPKGSLHQSVNIILNACKSCNVRKSDLEDDISAISMLRLPESIAPEAARKSLKSTSRRTGKKVAASSQEIRFSRPAFGGVTISERWTAPPQLDEARVYELAYYQLLGFFYAFTFDSELRQGSTWHGGFFPIKFSTQVDWGNPIQRWFMRLVPRWHDWLLGYLAHQNFWVAIRHHPTAEVWSWALEWNQTTRVIGFCGEEAAVDEVITTMPNISVQFFGRTSLGQVRARFEIPLAEGEDTLFSPNASSDLVEMTSPSVRAT